MNNCCTGEIVTKIARRILLEMNGIRLMDAITMVQQGTVQVELRLAFQNGVPFPETLSALKRQVKQEVEQITGLVVLF